MVNAYWISGVQLAMVKSVISLESHQGKIIQHILDNQFIGDMKDGWKPHEITITRKAPTKEKVYKKKG